MALIVRIEITNGRGTDLIEGIQIRRTEPLNSRPEHASDEVHTYDVTSWTKDGEHHRTVNHGQLHHRYGDGARTLAASALALITSPSPHAKAGKAGDGR